jgi:hypothetical protein
VSDKNNAPDSAVPECGWCNDSGVIGSPPDQYETCPYCTRRAAQPDTTASASGDVERRYCYTCDMDVSKACGDKECGVEVRAAQPVQAGEVVDLLESMELAAIWIESITPEQLELWRESKVTEIRRDIRKARASLAPVSAQQGAAVAAGERDSALRAEPASLLNADELAALRRFDECAQDGEGYDVPKEMMQRLAEIGVVRRQFGAYYIPTDFGMRVLNGPAPITTQGE